MLTDGGTRLPRGRVSNASASESWVCNGCKRRVTSASSGLDLRTGRPFASCDVCRLKNRSYRARVKALDVVGLAPARPSPVPTPAGLAFLIGLRTGWRTANGNTEFLAWLDRQGATADDMTLLREVRFQFEIERNNGLFTRWLDARIERERGASAAR